jgi:putative transposase
MILSPFMTYYHRRLPHWHPPGQEIFLTWRLHGSLPRRVPAPKRDATPGESFLHFDRILDQARFGPLWLKEPRIAESVISALADGRERETFLLRAYALMANHVHLLMMPKVPLAQLTQQIKGSTARHANLILSRTGTPFWQDESYDHWVRNPAEFQKIRTYIERNPVTAGLVRNPQDWPWSSASRPLDVAQASACGD